jgi:single-strand DNA-binding protein
MQFITIAGNVGKDAATKQVNGNTVTEWSIGVSGGRDSATTWYRCSLWGQRGEKLAGYITKGGKLVVTGDLTIGVYDGKPDCKVNVSQVTLMGGKQDGQRNDTPARGNGGNTRQTAFNDDDLDDASVPF